MRVIVTRPAEQAQHWVPRLQALGIDAVSLPLLGIAPTPDPAAVQAAWQQLKATALVMFVSANAVAHFFRVRPPAAVWPAGTLAGSTGPGTSAALRAHGVPAALLVEPGANGPFDSEALWQRLAARAWSGRQVLMVRGQSGRDWLSQQLAQAGAQVSVVVAYQRVPVVLQGPAADLLHAAQAAPQAHCWHFTSSEAIGNLVHIGAARGTSWAHSLALASHARIGEAARRAGFGQVALVGVQPHDVLAQLQAWQQGAGGASIESPTL